MVTLRIALRYLFAKKSHRAVNVISAVSTAGIAVATAAIVVVLSVYNGFWRLTESQFSAIDPEVMVVPRHDKVIANADSLADAIMTLKDVGAAVPTITERAMLIDRHSTVPIVFKALGPGYDSVIDIDDIIIDGTAGDSIGDQALMQISIGVANTTGLRPSMDCAAGIYVPRRVGRINPANPTSAFRSATLAVGGVVSAQQLAFDTDHVIIPLSVARQLLDYTTEATSIDIALTPGASTADAMAEISKLIGPDFDVLDRYMQQTDAFRMISTEKYVTLMMLIFILLIASFNLMATMSLLVIEKRADMNTLRALGASHAMRSRIFVTQGFIITVIGGAIGIVIGLTLSLLQQHFGLIHFDGDPALLAVTAYPVEVQMSDIAIVGATVVVVGAIVAAAARIFTKHI